MQEDVTQGSASIADEFDASYRVDDIIGEGNTGVVHKGWHKRLDKAIAIKFLHPQLLSDPKQVRQFLHEARQLGRLHHPNIVTVYSAGINPSGQPFIVMELIDGGKTLADRLKENRTLNIGQFEEIFAPILSAMTYLEQNGIVHRDLKPSNILLCQSENGLIAKVADFGIAKSLQPDITFTLAETNTGHLKGSPAYMSPEQCSGGKLDHRSDIYSLACVMYTCLVGQPPFEGETPFAVMYQHAHSVPAPLPASVPKHVAKAIQKALQKTPEARFNTFAEFRKKVLSGTSTISLRLHLSDLIRGGRINKSKLALTLALAGALAALVQQSMIVPETSDGPSTITGDVTSLFKRTLAFWEDDLSGKSWDFNEVIRKALNAKKVLLTMPVNLSRQEKLIQLNDTLLRSYGYAGKAKEQFLMEVENEKLFIDNPELADKLIDEYSRTQSSLADYYAGHSIPKRPDDAVKARAYAARAYVHSRKHLRNTEGNELMMRRLSQICVIQNYFLGAQDEAIKWTRKNLRHITERKAKIEPANAVVLCEQAEKIMDHKDLTDQSLEQVTQYALDAKEKALDPVPDVKLMARINCTLVRAYKRHARDTLGHDMQRALEYSTENYLLVKPGAEKAYSQAYVQAMRDVSDVRAVCNDRQTAMKFLTDTIKYIRSFNPVPKEALPEMAWAYLRRVQLMYAVPEEHRNYEAMQRSAEKILELDLEPTRTPMREAQYWMAVCLDHAGNKAAAKKHLQRYLEIASETGRWSEDCSEEKARSWLEKL